MAAPGPVKDGSAPRRRSSSGDRRASMPTVSNPSNVINIRTGIKVEVVEDDDIDGVSGGLGTNASLLSRSVDVSPRAGSGPSGYTAIKQRYFQRLNVSSKKAGQAPQQPFVRTTEYVVNPSSSVPTIIANSTVRGGGAPLLPPVVSQESPPIAIPGRDDTGRLVGPSSVPLNSPPSFSPPNEWVMQDETDDYTHARDARKKGAKPPQRWREARGDALRQSIQSPDPPSPSVIEVSTSANRVHRPSMASDSEDDQPFLASAKKSRGHAAHDKHDSRVKLSSFAAHVNNQLPPRHAALKPSISVAPAAPSPSGGYRARSMSLPVQGADEPFAFDDGEDGYFEPAAPDNRQINFDDYFQASPSAFSTPPNPRDTQSTGSNGSNGSTRADR